MCEALHWRHNDHGGVSNHQPRGCLTQSFIQTQMKENIKAPRHWPLCGEFTGTGEFPAQRASNAENVSIWWRHHESTLPLQAIVTQAAEVWTLEWILSCYAAAQIAYLQGHISDVDAMHYEEIWKRKSPWSAFMSMEYDSKNTWFEKNYFRAKLFSEEEW